MTPNLHMYWRFCLVLLFSVSVCSQETKQHTFIDVNYFSGNVALHKNDILHLINDHPSGIVIAWNKKTDGSKPWHQRYNYPDYGLSFTYQDFKTSILGKNYALNGHYNFYFFKRHLMLRTGVGLAYLTHPYDKENNNKNNAFGSTIVSSPYVMLNYSKERLWKHLGFQAGLALFHYSNGSFKAPNTSVNTVTFNLGLRYDLNQAPVVRLREELSSGGAQPIKVNILLSGGINESHVVGSGQYPFYIATVYADKKWNHVSALHLGMEVFFSNFLKAYMRYKSIAFPEEGVDPSTDHKRIGLFFGHELFISRLSFVNQLGYYVYSPFDFEGKSYIRTGFKYYFNQKWFAAVNLKSHAAKAEAVEFGLGIRL